MEVLTFLMPHLRPEPEYLQVFFFVLIASSVIFTLLMLRRHATPASWERNWQGAGRDQDLSQTLDAEHGSVNDLSHAVATRSEQLAEAMPGVLLIVGLLGTFIGLGMALDHASNILSQSQAAAGAADGAMPDLMDMMKGLGTKFKTSTWGIIAFLTLKLCSARMGVDDRRLRWCVARMKAQLDRERHDQLARAEAAQRQLVDAIGEMGERLADTLRQELSGERSLPRQQLELAAADTAVAAQSHQVMEHVNGLLERQLEQIGGLVRISETVNQSMLSGAKTATSNMISMASSSTRMAESANALMAAVGGLGQTLARLHDDADQERRPGRRARRQQPGQPRP